MKLRINVVAVASVLTLLLAASSQATLVKVDDFESGSLSTDWKTANDVSIVSDPDGGTNQVLRAQGGGVGKYEALNNTLGISNNSTATVFFRVQMISAAGSNPGSQGGFGVSDQEWATRNTSFLQNNLRTRIEPSRQFTPTRTETRVTSSFAPTTLQTDVETWQNIWLVLDTTADTFDMYMEGGPFATQTQVATGFDWYRSAGDGNDMVSFYLHGLGGADKAIYFDDIYVDTSGQNLANPTVASVPEASLFSLWLVGSLLMLGNRKRKHI